MLGKVAVEELTFKQIADRAGVPEGSAYHFYANKYDLLRALAGELSNRFIDAHKQPIDPKTIASWHDLADLIVIRGAEVYEANPAAIQICLGGKTPPEIKLEDRINDRAVSAVIEEVFDRFFVLPDLPRKHDIFFYIVELVDVIFALSVAEHGEITPEMLQEAKRVARGYLGTYLAPVLERREL